MTITTTTNKAGKISGYYVDGVKTRKTEIDYIINSRRDEIIEVDYYVGTEFKALTRSPYRLKVVFTGMDRPIMTQAAADKLGYKVIKVFTGSYNGTACIVEKETVVDEYAVSTEAQEVAIAAEIELATATDTTDEINIDDATYRTILLHAEKISNGQNSFAAVLKNELRNLLNVDASELIEAIKTDSNYLNRVRCYLADFPIIITNDEGTRYHLVKFTDDYCELDIINDEPATEQEKSTMTITERFWTKSYNRYGASRITAFATLDEAIASAKAEVAEDHDHWVDIIREVNNIPKVIETIEWKPELDELNDVDEPEPPTDDFATKLAELQAKRDAAQAALLKAQEDHETAENTLQKFLSDTAGDLATKLQSLNNNLDYSIKLVTKNGYSWTVTDFSDIYVDAFDGGKMFAFTDWRSRKYARYGTPTQVEQVIDMLREAIERGDTKFKFPTIDELNQPPMDTDLERKIKIEDSLRRAMEIATAEHERFLRLAVTSYNKGTRKDCLREADNELKLYNICWQATNELWYERW